MIRFAAIAIAVWFIALPQSRPVVCFPTTQDALAWADAAREQNDIRTPYQTVEDCTRMTGSPCQAEDVTGYDARTGEKWW